MDALEVLRNDQKAIHQLFEAYERGEALTVKEEQSQWLIEQLSIHASIEQTILFPAALAASGALKGLIRRCTEAHHAIANTLCDLEHLLSWPSSSPGHEERMDTLVAVLLEQVRVRVEEDRAHLFPAFRRAMDPGELESMGRQLIQGRLTARRHPPRVAPRAAISLGAS